MKKMEGMGGFFVAAVTPYDQEGNINAEAMTALMDRNLEEGASGFLIGGSSAESPLLTAEEKVFQLWTASQHPKRSKMALIGSCSAISERDAIQMARTVKDFGYDAAITTAPYYYKFGMKGIAHYLSKIREQADIPLFFYNFPGNTGVEIDLTDENIRAIMTDGTISGVKQTSLNLYQLERLRDMNPELVIYGGYDEVYLGARILGADGAIGSTFNFTLPLFTKIEAAYAERRIEDAQALQRRANNIMQALVSCQLFPSIKHILKVRGLDCGDCREPFGRLTEEQKAYVEKVVKENMEA